MTSHKTRQATAGTGAYPCVGGKPSPARDTHVSGGAFLRTADDGSVQFVLEDAVTFKAQLRKAFGDGEALVIRVEREADAKTYAQLKYFYGYVVKPLVEYTGDPDWAQELKVMFLPDDKRGLTECSYEEMRTFTERAESWARERCPEAYDRFGREYVA